MAKSTASYLCSSCGAKSNQWSGKCFECGDWGSLEADQAATLNVSAGSGKQVSGKKIQASPISKKTKGIDSHRLSTGTKEVDQVLGGGVVQGSVVLLAGQPGAGKSTLLLQVAAYLGKSSKTIYISGEESERQVSSRANRLKLGATDLQLASNNSADDIAATIASGDYDAVIVDSIQTINTSSSSGVQGGVSQIVNSTHMLINAAKQSDTALILVGHVTKEGNIAGPKLLEHLVDVVLQLEGDKFVGFKLLRGRKNRYGSVDEVAVMEMGELGMHPVDNPSAALLEERQLTDGSVIFAAMEGTKPLLVEIQALTNKSAFGYPKRTAVGFSQNRLNLIIAILEKRTKLSLSDIDIYISVSGGLTITEPAADLAVAMAIASSAKGLALPKDAAVYGEVGLGGEIRRVIFADKRAKEAKKVGFKTVIGPASTKKLDLKSLLNTYLK